MLKGTDWLAVSNNTSLVVPCYQLLTMIILFRFGRDRAAKKNKFSSKVTSFYPGGIFFFFCENQCTYDGTGKLCTSNDKHQSSLSLPNKKRGGGCDHKSKQIKITIFHPSTWVSLNLVRIEQWEMMSQVSIFRRDEKRDSTRNEKRDSTRKETRSIQTCDVRIIQ